MNVSCQPNKPEIVRSPLDGKINTENNNRYQYIPNPNPNLLVNSGKSLQPPPKKNLSPPTPMLVPHSTDSIQSILQLVVKMDSPITRLENNFMNESDSKSL